MSTTVPRWTPSSSPTSTPASVDKIEERRDDDDGHRSNSLRSSSSNLRSHFPFNIISGSVQDSDVPVSVLSAGKMELEQDDDDGVCIKGVSLTWKDLWVTVSDGKGSQRPILQALDGYAQPGQVLAVMGPSGCGKSTVLDALAGKFY